MARAPLTIRAGTARDVPTILALIRGLAEYERLAHQMEATAARVRAVARQWTRLSGSPASYWRTPAMRVGSS